MINNHALGVLFLAMLVAAVLAGRGAMEKNNQINTNKEVPMKLTSPSFENGEKIPLRYSCDHDNISPELVWSDVPPTTKSFAIIVDDPDAPVGTWVHWLIYNIPASARNLPEYVPDTKKIESGALQGVNDFRKIGYGGPCPPEGHGTHHYDFKLYALDDMLDIDAGASREKVETAMKSHVLGWTKLVGIYER